MSFPLALAEGKPFDVVGLGFNTLDHVLVVSRPPGPDSKQRLRDYLQQPGGQVPTALVALQRWGLRTAYVGPLSDDEGGRLQRASLEREGIDLSGCRTRDGGGQTSFILVDQITGARTVLWHRPEGLAVGLDEIDRELLTAGRFLLLDADDVALATQVAGWAKDAGTAVMLDVDEPVSDTPALLRLSDVVIVSGHFPQRLTGVDDLRRALARMLEMGPSLVVATLGSGGAVAAWKGQTVHLPALAVPVTDTTSAGDVFHAGCLYGLLRRWEILPTLRFATAAAALECTRIGGRAAVPPIAEVLHLAEGSGS